MKPIITILAAVLISLAAHNTAAAAQSQPAGPVEMVADMESASNLAEVIAGVTFLLVAIGCGYLFFHIIGDDKNYNADPQGQPEHQHS